MKKLFLASSFEDVADLFVKFTDGQCKGKTITFIPTASFPEDVNFYVSAGKEALEKRGLIVDELDISSATTAEIVNKLQNNNYIYVSGGNTFFLLQELKRTGADKILIEQIKTGKPYVGESAGTIVLSKNIEYVQEMDDLTAAPNLDSFLSLGVIDFYPLPHHTNFPFKEVVESIISNYAAKIELRPISNTQAIIVNGGKVEVHDK